MIEKVLRLGWSDGANPNDLSSVGKVVTNAWVAGHELEVPLGAKHVTMYIVCDTAGAETLLSAKMEASPNKSFWGPTSFLGNQVPTSTEVAADILDAIFQMQAPTDGKVKTVQLNVEGLHYVRASLKGAVGAAATARIFMAFYGEDLRG